jgi:hypothetical protein
MYLEDETKLKNKFVKIKCKNKNKQFHMQNKDDIDIFFNDKKEEKLYYKNESVFYEQQNYISFDFNCFYVFCQDIKQKRCDRIFSQVPLMLQNKIVFSVRDNNF